MEQLYLIEIFIDKVTIFVSENDKSAARKKLTMKIKFGPKVQFIIKEGQLANQETKDEIVECDDQGKRKWTRIIRVGKSYIFPSYPDTVLMILSKFPLEIEVWNDEENEKEIFVGVGLMYWDTEFYHMLKETTDPRKIHPPLSIKTITALTAECCCKQAGEIHFILRLTALGDSIITEFQQLMKDPEAFVFRTNKAPSMFQCKRIEGDDRNFCMVGSLYETTTLEDPDVIAAAKNNIEVCTELQSCGVAAKGADISCRHDGEKDDSNKKYPIDKIRMGDITGPCGNTNCPLAHKVKNYIRALDTYKKEAAGKVTGTKDNITNKICGGCSCKDDRYHRDTCPETLDQPKAVCTGCGGVTHAGETCEDRTQKHFGTGATPTGSKTQVAYVFSVTQVPGYKESMFGRDFTVENLTRDNNGIPPEFASASTSRPQRCCCRKSLATPVQYAFSGTSGSGPNARPPESLPSRRSLETNVYNVDARKSKISVYNCTEIPDEKDCKCEPPKPTPPCRTFDCDCIAEVANIQARKDHKPYCPLYKHKVDCPVNIMNEEEGMKKPEDDEDEAEPLPYGLPPIQLGPCPILGRPCSVPDGFARMYRNAVLPTQPPSYSDAGKVCCSKEYERIRKAIKEYMKNEKANDFRCINRFNVDTERRCCDKEQRLLTLMGKGCCGSHKMAIQEKYKDEKK